MKKFILISTLVSLLALAPVAMAQQTGDVHGRDALEPNRLENSPEMILNRLFGRLVQTDDADSAKVIEQAIWQLWQVSGSATADALMQQAAKAMEKQDFAAAIRLLNIAIELKPQFSEAWNRRATAHFLRRDFKKSLIDIEKVLELEPRHFGALSGRGMILRQQGDEAGALKAYRRAVRIHPHLPGPKAAVKELQLKLEQEI